MKQLSFFVLMAFLVSLSSFAAQSPTPVKTWHLTSLLTAAEGNVRLLGNPTKVVKSEIEAVQFDGVQDAILFDVNPIEGLEKFTIEALIWPDADGQAEQRFFHVEDKEGRRSLLETRVGNGTWALDTFLRSNFQTLALLDMNQRHPCGQWHWVALVFDGKEMKAYVNGSLQLAGPVKFDPMSAGPTSVGVRQNLVYWYKGAISELRFHSTAVSAEDLARVR